MRNGFSEEERTFIKECFKLLYESHFNRTQALEAIRKLPNFSRYPKIKDVFEAFFKENSERGLAWSKMDKNVLLKYIKKDFSYFKQSIIRRKIPGGRVV